VVNRSEEYPPFEHPRHHADACVSDPPLGKEISQARGELVAREDVEQLVVGKLAWRVMLGMGGTQLVEHRVEGRGDLLARGISWQGRSVRGAGLGPHPLDGVSIVEVLPDQARHLLDERRSDGKGLDLGRDAKVQPQQGDGNDHRQDDRIAQTSK
jgi:hypothetical protein